jgi:WD40 repeat protein
MTAMFELQCFIFFLQASILIKKSYLVEWNESEGAIKRTYSGFRKRSSGVVQFDTTRNRFLAAGDEFLIKFWDMDNTNLLTTIDAEGGLPVSNV